MSPVESAEEKEAMMLSLIMMLSENAWTMLGKRANPVTNKEEISLEGAQAMIDILHVLQIRTEGNVTERENSMLQAQLTNLRLNYVEVAREHGGSADTGEEAKAPEEAAAAAEIPEPEPEASTEKEG